MTTAADLLAAVRGFLKADIAPKLSLDAAFKLKVAANALSIAEREAQAGAETKAAACAAMANFLGKAGSYEDHTNSLTAQIRAGKARWDDPALLACLETLAAGKLRIDNPRYPALQALAAAESGESALSTPRQPL